MSNITLTQEVCIQIFAVCAERYPNWDERCGRMPPSVYNGGMRASDKAYETLRDEILDGTISPGTVLGEVEQSERLGVSRTPLREALARLAAEGLAIQQRGRGTVVSDVSLDHVEDLFELRSALEVQAARLAARRVTAQQEASFLELALRFRTASQVDAGFVATDYYALAASLDAAIDEAVRNDYLANALKGLRTHLARVRRLAQDQPTRLAASASEHALIAEAIAQGSPELAEAATRVHLNQSLQHIQKQTAHS